MVRLLPVFLAFLAIVGALPVQAQWVKTSGPESTLVLASGSEDGSLYAGKDGGVFKSTDTGATWTSVNSGLTNTAVRALIVFRGSVYAGTQGGGIFQSTNNGGNWLSKNVGLGNLNVRDFDVSIGGALFAGTDIGLYVSTDSGKSWAGRSTGLTSLAIKTVSFATINSQLGNAVGTDSGVFFSANSGVSWTAINSGITNKSIRVLGTGPSTLYVGTGGGGLYWRDYSSSSWALVNSNLGNSDIRAFASSGNSNYSGVVAGSSNGIFLVNTSGTSWDSINTGLVNRSVRDLAVPLVGAPFVFAAMDDGIWRRPIGEVLVSSLSYSGHKVKGFHLDERGRFRLTLSSPTHVAFNLVDGKGRSVVAPFSGWLPAGLNSLQLGNSTLPAGLYFFRLQVGDQTETRKVVLTR